MREDGAEIGTGGLRGPDVAARLLRQVPAVFQYFVEDLGRRQPVAQAGWDGCHHRVVEVLQPAVSRDGPRYRLTLFLLQVAVETGDIVEQSPGLVLLRADTRLPEKLPAELPGLGDLRPDPLLAAAGCADQLQLVGVEAELIETAEPLRDPVALFVGPQYLLAGQLTPQPFVPALQLLASLNRVDPGREQPGSLEVEKLPADPFG